MCHVHGGAAPQTRAAAERRLAIAVVRGELERLGVPIKVEPIEALLGQVREAAGNVEYLRRRVQELEELYGADHLGDARAHVLVNLYNEERDRLARMAKLALDAGIAEATVEINRRHGELLAAVVARVLEASELHLSDEQRRTGFVIAARELRLVESTSADEGEPSHE